MALDRSLLHRRIALLASATIVVGVIWILRDAVLVRVFGTSTELDHFMALAIAATVVTTLIAGALASTVVPEYMRRRAVSPKDASTFYWTLSALGISLSFPLGVATTIVLATSGLMSLSWLTDNLNELLGYGLGVGMVVAAGVFGRLAAGVMNTHDRVFLQPALLALPMVGPISVALLLPASGAQGLFLGLVLGSLLQCTIAVITVCRDIPLDIGKFWQNRRLLRPTFLLENAHLGAGTALMAISELALNSAAAAIGPGALTQLTISQRLPQLFQTFAGGVMATAAYPIVADRFIKGDINGGNRLTILLATISAVGGAVAATLVGMFADPFTELLTGAHMPTAGRQVIASMLLITAWQIPFAVAGTIMSRAVIAANRSRILSIGALAYLVAVCIAGAAALGSYNVIWAAGAPIVGYALSSGIVLLWILRRPG